MDDLFDDVEPYKLAKTGDPETSKEAAKIAPTGKMRTFVYDLIIKSGLDGITIKEMTKAYSDIQSSSITSRPNELEKSGLIFYRGDRRDGSRVIRDNKHDTGWRCCPKCSGVLLSFYDNKCQGKECKTVDLAEKQDQGK